MADPQHDPNMPFEASFSVLLTSLASSAVMALGLAPNPQTHEVHKDRHMAKFNIDLLSVLKEKTKGNLSQDECRFLDALLSDLQMKFIQMRD
jgi:hypothetical protein